MLAGYYFGGSCRGFLRTVKKMNLLVKIPKRFRYSLISRWSGDNSIECPLCKEFQVIPYVTEGDVDSVMCMGSRCPFEKRTPRMSCSIWMERIRKKHADIIDARLGWSISGMPTEGSDIDKIAGLKQFRDIALKYIEWI